MTYKGTVAGGVVVPQRGVQLPEGADVRIQLVKRAKRRKPKIMRHAGAAKSLPADASRSVDHYLYGHPRGRLFKF